MLAPWSDRGTCVMSCRRAVPCNHAWVTVMRLKKGNPSEGPWRWVGCEGGAENEQVAGELAMACTWHVTCTR